MNSGKKRKILFPKLFGTLEKYLIPKDRFGTTPARILLKDIDIENEYRNIKEKTCILSRVQRELIVFIYEKEAQDTLIKKALQKAENQRGTHED